MSNSLPTSYQKYIHTSRYARFIDDLGRRETWEETVTRYFDFMEKHLKKNHKYSLPKELRSELEGAVLSLRIMPSMRALMTAGAALESLSKAAPAVIRARIEGIMDKDNTAPSNSERSSFGNMYLWFFFKCCSIKSKYRSTVSLQVSLLPFSSMKRA